MTAEAEVEFHNVSFTYTGVPVLENINLYVQAEEFFGLIGPNGAGKSTLLRLLLGLEEPSTGTVRVFGTTPGKARTRIGYVPQYSGYHRGFPVTVADVVLTGRLGITGRVGRYTAQDHDMVREAMEAVAIDDLGNRSVSGLSGGQMQRMLIARALACEPRLLILDEPTANIDVRAEESIFSWLKQYNAHMTIIVVSHDVAFISGYVNRVGCLNRTLVCHETSDISGKTIEELYGSEVRMIRHSHVTP